MSDDVTATGPAGPRRLPRDYPPFLYVPCVSHVTDGQYAEAVRVEELVPGVGLEVLDRERKATILDIDRGDDRFDFLILLERFRRMFDALGP